MGHPGANERVIAVLPTESEARRLRDVLVADLGLADRQIRIGQADDAEAELRVEMRDELEGMVVGAGNVGPFTRSMARGVLTGVAVGAAVGALLGFGLAFLPWTAGLSLWQRIVVGLVSGIVAGATAGFTAGGFSRSRKDQEGEVPLAPERGAVLAVFPESEAQAERVAATLSRAHPERLDRVDAQGRPIPSPGSGWVVRPTDDSTGFPQTKPVTPGSGRVRDDEEE